MELLQDTKIEVKMHGSIADVDKLFSPISIRAKCNEIFQLASHGETHFKINFQKLNEVVQYVSQITLNNYPTLNIPFHSQWTHFQTGKINRMLEFQEKVESLSLHEVTKAKLAFIIISILLEGTAGLRWRYREDKKEYSRSEGQAIACLRMFMSGLFSSDPLHPLKVDAKKLRELTLTDLEKGFQSCENNMLSNLEFRLNLLHKLGAILQQSSEFFGSQNPGLGNILEFLLELSSQNQDKLTAPQILYTVQKSLGSLWQGKVELAGINLGDVSIYKPLGEGIFSLVPFHRLSQWLTYSLLEPLAEHGLIIAEIDQLTGLAEYRNGGLLLDSGLLELKDPALKEVAHQEQSEIIVEWRALTVALLDELGKAVAQKLGKLPTEFPLVRVLEGGTWHAGRALAQKLREDGSPPLRVLRN
ncbi:MAG: DUF1688 family protein [Bdellovibrionota bacterium]